MVYKVNDDGIVFFGGEGGELSGYLRCLTNKEMQTKGSSLSTA